ncbi:MAG: hypothetical protein HC942_17710, partial [Microcoleus sp. SU_5_6]|nr:hypothetical protein [Microcoleus sp. SU_5_6]
SHYQLSIDRLSTVNEEGGHGGTPPLRFAPTNSKLKTQNFRTTLNYQLFK